MTQATGRRQDVPPACNLGAFDSQQSERHRELIAGLKNAVQAVSELPDGYAYRFSSEAEVCREVMEFVTLERLCCPFFTFRLELTPQSGPLILSLTGPEGAKEILRHFLQGSSRQAQERKAGA